ncbi:MAG: hypothetical protein K9M81_03125 [Chthoniobacterales bacterium]|nr:hypothetical protein [Chthoniobacterales bacterium]
MLLGQHETYSRRRNPSPSLTRSLSLVSPFQGCLARIFHTDLLRKPGSQMDAALISKSSSGSMYSYSRRQTSSLASPHQPSRPPRHDQYEISGLKAVSTAVSGPPVVSSSGFAAPRDEPV